MIFHEWVLRRLISAIEAMTDFNNQQYPEGRIIAIICLDALAEVDFPNKNINEVILVLEGLSEKALEPNININVRLRKTINILKKRTN